MIRVVAGPIHTKFVRLIANIVAIGTKTFHRLFPAMNPEKPEGAEPKGVFLTPGYVRARMTGSAVCRLKKIGKIACWREENWGRGRALYATGPPMKVLVRVRLAWLLMGLEKARGEYLEEGGAEEGTVSGEMVSGVWLRPDEGGKG